MSIRPVDYQILMPKVNEVGKLQSDEQQKLIGQAQQNANNTVKEADHDTRSVHTQREAQKTVITEEQRKQSGQQGQKQGKKGGDAEEDDNGKPGNNKLPQERHTIDIRI